MKSLSQSRLTGFLILLFIWSLINGQSNPLRFTPLEIRGAVPFLTIDFIFQDSRGLMWFGTYGGLYSYDGYSLTHFSHDPNDSTSLGDNKIRCIHEDPRGNLWIGTQMGLHMFDPKSRIFKNYTDKYQIGNSEINRIFQDSSQNLWVLTANGLFTIGLNTLEVDNQSIKYQFDQIYDLTIDSKGSVSRIRSYIFVLRSLPMNS